MKRIAFIFISLVFFSCSKSGILSIPIKMSNSLDIAVTANTPDNMQIPLNVDAGNDPEMQQYLSRVKSFSVKSISYEIQNFYGNPGTELTGNVSIGDINIGINKLILDKPGIHTLELTGEQLAAISADFSADHAVSAMVSGTVTNKPAAFRIKFTFNVSVRL
jgi:hypothetical protein